MSRIALARGLRKRMTPQEVKLWCELRRLRPAGLHFRRQVPIGGYIVDFACRRRGVVIEVDGGQHGWSAEAAVDSARDAALETLGFSVLRFWNDAVDREIGSVVDHIVRVSKSRPITRHAVGRSDRTTYP